MNQNECGMGFQVPSFISPTDTQSIRQAFFTQGVAFVDSCNETQLTALTKELGEIQKPRNECKSGSGMSRIRLDSSLKGKAYTSKVLKLTIKSDLFFHTDRSGWDLPPRILSSLLQVKVQTGGESLLVDGQRVLEVIKQQYQSLYELMTSSNHSSFKDDDGYFRPRAIFDKKTNLLRFRFDDGIQLSGSMIERLDLLKKIIYQSAFVVALQPGQGYIVDNYRYLHGRSSFTGSRELLRILANPTTAPTPATIQPKVKTIAILFDVDGTLCRADDLSIDAFFPCLGKVAGRDITNANTKVNLHGQTDLGLLLDILRYHHVDKKEIPSIIDRFLQLHPHYMEDSLSRGFVSKPCPVVNETLDWLTKQKEKKGGCTSYITDIRIGLVTGNCCQNALSKIRAAGIDTSLFDLEISSFGDGHDNRLSLLQQAVSKIYRTSDTTSSVSVDDIVVVGDTPLDIESARKSGCSVVAVATGNYDRDTLETFHPNLACDTVSDAEKFFVSKIF